VNLLWAGPWNERSAIAQVGSRVVAALVQLGHQVEVIRTETGPDTSLPARRSDVPVRFWKESDVRRRTARADALIVNLGDHYGFHGAMLPALFTMNAVGIIHDRVLAHLMLDWALRSARGEASLRPLVNALYGPQAWPLGQPFATAFATPGGERTMLELLAGCLAGAIVHAEHYAGPVRSSCPGPVAALGLPLLFDDLPAPRTIPARELVVASIGVVNANKRVDQLLHAIGSHPRLRQVCRVRVIGPIEETERDRLTALARRLDISAVSFTGWVSDAQLCRELEGVDVMSCLRYPALEGGSASLVLALQSGRPTLVSHHGVYAEVPEDAVLPCTPGDEAPDIARHLEWVLDEPGRARELGERARAYVSHEHSIDRYSRGLIDLTAAAVKTSPATQTGRALGRTLATFGVDADDPAVSRIAEALADLLGGRP
jgi:glycosyltransferase involved in cell wall biosynthesis